MASQIVLVLGGIRSGKSAFAESLARKLDQPALYLATGQATDQEMAERIRRHQESRPSSWVTLEEPLDPAGALESALAVSEPPGVILVDSLDVWVSNLLLKHEEETAATLESLARSATDHILEVCSGSPASFFLVSSEVGLTLVPPYPLGRRFQDLVGLVNQRVAAAANQVYLVVAGIPVELKG